MSEDGDPFKVRCNAVMQFNIKYGNLTAVCKMIIMYDLLFEVMDKDSGLCLVSDSLLLFFP